MNKYLLTVIAILGILNFTQAQSKIKDGTVTGSSSLPNSNAILELESTNKGLLLPRLALSMTTDPSPLSAHVAGMTVYNTATAGDVTPGFYYNDGTQWVPTKASAIEPWNIQSTTNQATSNTQDIYQTGKVGVGAGFDAATTDKQMEVAGSFKASYDEGNYSIFAETGWAGQPINALGVFDQNGNEGGALFYQNQGTNTMQVISAFPANNRQSDFQQTEDQVSISSNDANNGNGTTSNILAQSSGNIYLTAKESGTNPPSSQIHLDPNGWFYSHSDETAGNPTTDTYYFPNIVGSAGQVLTSNGANPAQLYWSDKTTAVEPWNITTTTIQAESNTQNIYQTGKVGIGDGFSGADPSHQLQVNGDFMAVKVSGDSILAIMSNAEALGGSKDMVGIMSGSSTYRAFSAVTSQYAGMGYQSFSENKASNLQLTQSEAGFGIKDDNTNIEGTIALQGDIGNAYMWVNNPVINYESRILLDHNVNGAITISSSAEGQTSSSGHQDFTALTVEKGKGIRFENDDNAGNITGSYTFPVNGGSAGQVLTSQGGWGGQLYWSDKNDVTPVEPWFIEGTTTQADSNTQNIYQAGRVMVGEGSNQSPIMDQLEVRKPEGAAGNDVGITINDFGTHRISHFRFDGMANGSQGYIDWRKAGSNAVTAAIRSVGFNTNATKGLGFFTNNDYSGDTDALERMRIAEDGNVGIGTTTPTEKLEINGAMKVGDGGYTGINNNDTSPIPAGGAGTIIFSNGNFYGWNGTNWKQLDM